MRVPVKSMLGIALSILSSMSFAAEPSVLELVTSILLPGVKGRIDHLSIDVEKARLFVAALGNNSVEVIDLKARRLERSLGGFGEPQGVLYLSAGNRLYVANGSADRVDLLEAASLTLKKRFTGLSDADNVRFDAAAGKVYVGYGRGALRVIDVASETLVANIALAGHPESFQLEGAGTRIFVNVPTANQIAVVDRAKNEVVATWPTLGAASNFPMSLDETNHRLFVGARRPAVMLVYDTTNGKVGARVPIAADTDDLFYDVARKRVYVICGEGTIDVFRQATPDQYAMVERIRTAPRARTGLFVAGLSQLYVAAPAADGNPARILIYDIH